MAINKNLVLLVDVARSLLHADGIALDDGQVSKLEQYVGLICAWNPTISLVSAGDFDHIWERHVLDSLSLAGVVQRLGLAEGQLLDIGSGGGFPAIPMAIVLPNLRISLVERSQKKAGFLRKAIGSLGLAQVTLCVGEFPRAAEDVRPDVITSRAVETPTKVIKHILPYVDRGAVYLSQSGAAFANDYIVDRVADAWGEEGLCRGSLDIVRRRGTA